MKPTKLTARLLSNLKAGERVRDTTVKGLFAECGQTGVSLKIQADLWQGERGTRQLVRTVRMTLGKHPELSLDDARARAMAQLADIKRGIDPSVPAAAKPGELTVGQMFEAY